jgi:hypothetical protein
MDLISAGVVGLPQLAQWPRIACTSPTARGLPGACSISRAGLR